MEDITVLYIIFGIIGLGFLMSAVFMGIHIFRRWKTRSVLFHIIGVDGKIKKSRISNPQPKNKVFGKTYIYDEKAEYRDFWNKSIFYYENIPNPIIFDRESQKVKVSSEALNNIVEDDFIKKLFNPADILSIENILGYITVALLVIMFYFLVIDQITVKIAQDPETMRIIGQACKQALTGG